MSKKVLLSLVISAYFFCSDTHAQVGKDGPRTISVANTIVNEYTYLTANAAAGATTLTVNNNNLNANSRFTAALAQGDLILIIQMQGATVDATALGAPFATFSIPNSTGWGAVTNYNNCGNYEFAQVLSVTGTNTITILCGLKNSYTSAGHVQVVRVPRYTTLTINSSLTGENWNGNTGGIIAVEPQTSTTINAGGSIVSTGIGFRGGVASENLSGYGAGQYANDDGTEGAEKGEGIVGFTTEYNAINGQFCMGAAANAGGGGNGHNAGGGGGGNGGSIGAWTGLGVSNPAYNAAWALEVPSLVGSVSSGGGRGGNTFSNANGNANSDAPGAAAWGGASDVNRNVGGLGGRPLDYSTGKLFIGGGGGAGDQNDGDAGGGGRGAGLVFIMSYGTVSGSGSIVANGNAGTSALNGGGGFNGKDGAGGGGAGGTVIINSNSTISGITINANGGAGGNVNLTGAAAATFESYGPGGGGGGGYIAVSNGTPTRTATGGVNGTTNSLAFTEFPPKGATSGNTGLPTETYSNYYFTLNNVSICYGATATLTATVTGTVPGGTTLNWYATQFSTTSLGSGTTFTTPALTTTTTYYVGFCPGWYRLPVTVTVGPQIVINTSSMLITNATCGLNNGSITGITASGGTGALTYTWNGTLGTANLTGIGAGSYTLVVTDASSCTASVGPFAVTATTSPVINTASMVITNSTCGSSNGSISGITVSGGSGALSYTWNGSPAAGPDIGPVAAGSYTLGVTDAAGCSATAGPFTISNVGGVTINASGAVVTNNTCGLSNGSVTGITASSPAGGLVYTWNGTAGTANLTGVAGGSYTLVVTDAVGCSATTGPYTITNLPGPTISGTATVTNESCAGNDGSITGLSVSGGTGTVDIAWNGTITGSASATGLTAGTYTLTATDDNGCVATSGPYTITNSGGPSINTASMIITNATCGNPNGSITGITTSGGTGALTFTWNGTASPSTDLSSAAAGSYTLVVTDGSGCTATAGPFSITTSGGVTINTSGVVITDATCGATNGSVTGITSSSTAGGLTFDWNGTAYPSNDLTAVGGGTYTLTVTDAVGCTASAGPFTIQNIGAPVIDISAINVSGTTCGLNNGTITGITVTGGSGALTYDWNGTSSVNQDLNASAAGSYTLTVTDATGCSQSAGPFTLAASNSITASASVTTNASCFGYTDGAASGSFTGGNGSETYQWIGGPATQNYTGIGAGTYEVIVTDVQGCSDTATVTITEPPSFNPTISGTSPICEGTSTTLTGAGGGSYSWSSGGSTSTETVSPTTTTTYTLTVTNGACSEDTTFTVVVNPLPVASISGTTAICDGQSTTLTASGGTSYVWDDASTGTSVTVSPTSDTPYYVIAQNSCGTDTAYVTVTVGVAFTVDAGPDQTIGLGNSANISASGGISWSWSPAGSLDCATCQSPTATPSGTTTYTVTATSAGGCTATDDVTIIVDATEALFVPDIFAPNGGMNNILYVRGSGISEFTFRVYDRWGQKVFETTELSLGWDGTYSGRTLDTGVFVYTLEGKFYSGNEFSQKGNVTLKR